MKKQIPLKVRQVIESIIQENRQLFNVSLDKYSKVKILDADPNSFFHFTFIESYLEEKKNNKDEIIYNIAFTPRNEHLIEEVAIETDFDGFAWHFKNWCTLIEKYNEESSIFGDSISQSYYDELEPDFKIVDEDADYKPFSIEQQKAIVAFLNRSKKLLAAQKKDIDDAEGVISLIEEAKRTISRCTKSQVVKKIRKIVAKGFKVGLQVGEKLLIDFSTELAKKLLTSGH